MTTAASRAQQTEQSDTSPTPTVPTSLVLDVDGVLTDGSFLYTAEGKVAKTFGPHDADGIKLLRNRLEIRAITADKRGFPISQKRLGDMEIPLELVSEPEREQWFRANADLQTTIFIGDGMHDAKIFLLVGYSIAPTNAFYLAKQRASFVTQHRSGEGAVGEACLHILEKFFGQTV